MQQFKYFEPQSLTVRRFGFMKDIRNVQREEFKKKARSQVLTRTANEQLNYLINTTKQNITNQDLGMLIRYANQHNHKAVAHLGNLIIDGVAKVAQLEKFTLEPDYHPYWLWLVEVLIQNSYCTIGLFQHCIKSITPNRLEKTVKHALTVLYKITSSNMYSSFLMREESVLLSIANATLRQDSASKVAYLLIYELINKQQGLAQRFQEGILRQRIVLSIKNGLESRDSVIRNDSFKIITELATRQVFLYEINEKIISFIKSEQFETNSELCLEYLLQISLTGTQDQVVIMIDKGLLVELGKWKRTFEDEDNPQTGKIIEVCRQIRQKVNDMGLLTKGIHRELQRLNLLSFNAIFQS